VQSLFALAQIAPRRASGDRHHLSDLPEYPDDLAPTWPRLRPVLLETQSTRLQDGGDDGAGTIRRHVRSISTASTSSARPA
jgi:hypothetical protein